MSTCTDYATGARTHRDAVTMVLEAAAALADQPLADALAEIAQEHLYLTRISDHLDGTRQVMATNMSAADAAARACHEIGERETANAMTDARNTWREAIRLVDNLIERAAVLESVAA